MGGGYSSASPSIVLISCPVSPYPPFSIPYHLSFHTLAHSFALTKNASLLFSIDSALFTQNTPGVGQEASILLTKLSLRSADPVPLWRTLFSAKVAGKRYGVVCVGKALEPDGEKWKRMSQSLGTLWPSTSGE